MKFLLCLYLGKIGLGIVFGDVLDRNQVSPDYNNIDFLCSPNWIFLRG